MIGSLAGLLPTGKGGSLLSGVLCLVLMGGLALTGRAQVPADTVQEVPAGAEPAELDSLPSAAESPPLQPPGMPNAAPDTGDTDRVYVNADSLSALQRNGKRIQELFGNVFVRQDTTRLRSDYGRRYLQQNKLLFVDNVVIYGKEDTLRADTVRYNRVTEVGRARGHVRLTDGDVMVRAKRGTYYAEADRTVFPDSVVLVDSNRVLRAQHGTYWSDEQRAEFGGTVRLTEPGTTLLADSLTYYRNRDRSVARGDVFIDRRRDEGPRADMTTQTYLFGNQVDNRERRRYSRVEGRALLIRVRIDSTGTPTDTLVVRSHRLDAVRTDTHRRIVAVDSVRIWTPDLAAVADSVVYDRVTAPTADSTGGPTVPIDTARPPPDSVSVIARKNPPETDSSADARAVPDSSAGSTVGTGAKASAPTGSAPAPPGDGAATSQNPLPDSLDPAEGDSEAEGSTRNWTTPTAQSDTVLPLEEIRLFQNPMTWFEGSQVWGDSIRVRAQNRTLDTVFVRGSAFAAQRDSALARTNQLKARNITAFFRSDSLRRIRGAPNARAIRFLASDADSLSGAIRASGDWVVVRLLRGGGRRIKFGPGIEGRAYDRAKNIPEPFTLEGFRWTPERRPTRAALLRQKRVRQRLDLDLSPQRPLARQAQQPPSAPRADSVGRTPPLQEDSFTNVPAPLQNSRSGDQRGARDSLRTRPAVRPDSIPSPRRPAAPPDTSQMDPKSQL